MAGFRGTDERAVSSVVGVAILAGIVVIAATITLVLVQKFDGKRATGDPVVTGAEGKWRGTEYDLRITGPDAVPVDRATLVAVVDGVEHRWPATELGPQLSDPEVWAVGEAVCIVGAPPCLLAVGTVVAVQVLMPQNVVFTLPQLTYVNTFSILPGGGIQLMCDMPAVLRVLGVEITYGAGGPDIPVTAGLSSNGAAPFAPLFGGLPISGGQLFDLSTVPAGSILGVEGFASYQDFQERRDSFSADPHAYVLRDGDMAPDFAPFAGQAPLEGFLAPYVDVGTGTMTLAPEEAIVLFEFVDNLGSAAADFQDLVVLFDFESAQC